MPTPEVSFIVIAHNEARGIAQCLRAIAAQDARSDFEVVVVDDGSRDGTADVAEAVGELGSRLHVVRLAQNRGRGHARQVGCEAAAGGLLAFVDADIVLPRHWLGVCISELGDADAVGGTAVPDGDLAYVYRRCRLQPKPVPQSTTVTGSNGLYRRELFDRVAFDSALREGEDVALNHALAAAGARTHTVKDLYVRHEEHKSFRQSVAWLFASGRGASRQLLRYRALRLPDAVFAGFVASGIGGRSLFRNRRGAKWIAPGYLLAAAVAHTGRAFAVPTRRPDRFLAGVAVDACLLLSYFSGRLVGLIEYRRELLRPPTTAGSAPPR